MKELIGKTITFAYVDGYTAFKHKLEDKKIHVGDEVFVHGYVDEIRKDVVKTGEHYPLDKYLKELK